MNSRLMDQMFQSYPSALPKAVKSKLVRDLSCIHRILDIVITDQFPKPVNVY